jgi:hypothetical protein
MAINSQGSKLQHSGPGSPAAYVDLEEVTSIGGPDGSLNLIDVSHLGSSRKEYLPGLADNGTIQVEANFTGETKQMDMFDLFNNTSDPEPFRILIPTDSTRTSFHQFDFLGIVSKWSVADAVDSKVKLTMTIQTTGGVTYTAP